MAYYPPKYELLQITYMHQGAQVIKTLHRNDLINNTPQEWQAVRKWINKINNVVRIPYHGKQTTLHKAKARKYIARIAKPRQWQNFLKPTILKAKPTTTNQ